MCGKVMQAIKCLSAALLLTASSLSPAMCIIIGAILRLIHYGNSNGVYIIRDATIWIIIVYLGNNRFVSVIPDVDVCCFDCVRKPNNVDTQTDSRFTKIPTQDFCGQKLRKNLEKSTRERSSYSVESTLIFYTFFLS
jgi:hypothetical protein